MVFLIKKKKKTYIVKNKTLSVLTYIYNITVQLLVNLSLPRKRYIPNILVTK